MDNSSNSSKHAAAAADKPTRSTLRAVLGLCIAVSALLTLVLAVYAPAVEGHTLSERLILKVLFAFVSGGPLMWLAFRLLRKNRFADPR